MDKVWLNVEHIRTDQISAFKAPKQIVYSTMNDLEQKIAILGIILATFGTPLGPHFDFFGAAKGPNWLVLMLSTQIQA